MLWEAGASSGYIMAQMGHKHWATSELYIFVQDKARVPWRSQFEGEPGDKRLAVAAELAPILTQPQALAQFHKAFHSRQEAGKQEVEMLEEEMLEAAEDGIY